MRADSHFLRLASVGHFDGCSSGEAQALRLAQCVVANVPGLDSAALDGLMDFIYATASDPMEAREMVRCFQRRPKPPLKRLPGPQF